MLAHPDWLTLTALGLATNIDNLGVGVAYGVRRVTVRPLANLIMAAISTAATLLSALAGRTASRFDLALAHLAGVALMMAIGLWVCVKAVLDSTAARAEAAASAATGPRQLARLRIASLGIVISVLHEPLSADVNRSGAIDPAEAVMLGAALAINCLAGGFAGGLAGLNPAAVSLAVGAGSYASLWLGLRLGARAQRFVERRAGIAAGGLMVLLALLQLVVR